MVNSGHAKLSIVRQRILLKVTRSSLYYERTGESAIKTLIDAGNRPGFHRMAISWSAANVPLPCVAGVRRRHGWHQGGVPGPWRDHEWREEFLGMWISPNEGAKFWLAVVTELRNRGVQGIFIACVDGLKGFPAAIKAYSLKRKSSYVLCIWSGTA